MALNWWDFSSNIFVSFINLLQNNLRDTTTAIDEICFYDRAKLKQLKRVKNHREDKLVFCLSPQLIPAPPTRKSYLWRRFTRERADDKNNNDSCFWDYERRYLPLRYVSRFWIWQSTHLMWASMLSCDSSDRKAMQFLRFCFQYRPYAKFFVLDLTCWFRQDRLMRNRECKQKNLAWRWRHRSGQLKKDDDFHYQVISRSAYGWTLKASFNEKN